MSYVVQLSGVDTHTHMEINCWHNLSGHYKLKQMTIHQTKPDINDFLIKNQ